MTRSTSIALALAALLTGCALRSSPPWVVAGAQPVAAADEQAPERLFDPVKSFSGKVTMAAATHPEVLHAGLQLPRVSPDGRWIATLAPIAPDAAGFNPASLLDGDGLSAVQLIVSAVDGKSPAQVVHSPGPCWPTWLDNDRLMFISYNDRDSCALAIYDRATGNVQRKGFGLRHMFAPAAHPDAKRVAVCGWGNVPDDAVIFLADLDTLQLFPGPPVTETGRAQLFPHWLGGDTLIYVELGKEHATLRRWTVGERASHEIAQLSAPPDLHDAQHILGGIIDPVSPGLTHYAAFLPAHDAVVLTSLDDGSKVVTRRSTRAGAWWSDDWFVAAREDKLELVAVDGQADPPNTLALLDGQWAPVWTSAKDKTLILVGPGSDASHLKVLQLWLVLEDE